MTNEELILKKLDELIVEVKEMRSEIKDGRSESTTAFKKIRSNMSEINPTCASEKAIRMNDGKSRASSPRAALPSSLCSSRSLNK